MTIGAGARSVGGGGVEEDPGVAEVGGVEPFGEAAVDGQEERAGEIGTRTPGVQAGQIGGGAQRERQRALPIGDGECRLEAGECLGVAAIAVRSLEDVYAFQSMQFRFVAVLPGSVRVREGLVENGNRRVTLATPAQCLGQQGEEVRLHESCTRGVPRREPPANLVDPR